MSATAGLGIGELLDEIVNKLPEAPVDETPANAIRVAVVGRKEPVIVYEPMRHNDFSAQDMWGFAEQANKENLIILQIEQEKAIENIDDILSLKVQTQLERRLQTIVYRKGLARSPKQARQLITHGHIAIAGRRVNIPGYHVTRTDEGQIAYYGTSPFVSDSHAEKVRIAKPASNPKPVPGSGGYSRGGMR